MKHRMSAYFIGAAMAAIAIGVSLTVAAHALAQGSTYSPPGYTPPTAPPPVAVVTPPKPVVVPQTPRPDFTRSYTPPTVPEIPEIPNRPDPGFPGGRFSGDRGSLNQLQSVSSIGQLLAVPVATETAIPSVTLHKLENRMPLIGPAGQTAGNGVAPEGRAGAMQALESAKPIL